MKTPKIILFLLNKTKNKLRILNNRQRATISGLIAGGGITLLGLGMGGIGIAGLGFLFTAGAAVTGSLIMLGFYLYDMHKSILLADGQRRRSPTQRTGSDEYTALRRKILKATLIGTATITSCGAAIGAGIGIAICAGVLGIVQLSFSMAGILIGPTFLGFSLYEKKIFDLRQKTTNKLIKEAEKRLYELEDETETLSAEVEQNHIEADRLLAEVTCQLSAINDRPTSKYKEKNTCSFFSQRPLCRSSSVTTSNSLDESQEIIRTSLNDLEKKQETIIRLQEQLEAEENQQQTTSLGTKK